MTKEWIAKVRESHAQKPGQWEEETADQDGWPREVARSARAKGKFVLFDAWVSRQRLMANELLNECLVIDPETRGGIPVLSGTRFTISQVLAELADGNSLPEISADYGLPEEKVVAAINGLAMLLHQPR